MGKRETPLPSGVPCQAWMILPSTVFGAGTLQVVGERSHATAFDHQLARYELTGEAERAGDYVEALLHQKGNLVRS